MMGSGEHHGMQEARIILGLLESVERDAEQTQRRLASELGVALGLVNTYIKRCVKKGLLKAGEAPTRRYGYYLTPQGFSEKARLTAEYLAYSFSLFRRARSEYRVLIAAAVAAEGGKSRIALAGVSDLAEIATICSLEAGVTVVAMVDPASDQLQFVGIPVFKSFDLVVEPFDAVVITALEGAARTFQDACEQCGQERVFFPPLLGFSQTLSGQEGA